MSRRLTARAAVYLVVLLCALVAETSAASPRSEDRATVARWLSETRAWEDLPSIAAHINSDEPEIRANAVLAFGSLWDANLALAKPRGFVRLDYRERKAVVEALENHFGVMSAADRKRSLEVTASLRYIPELMPLLLIAAADQDVSLRNVGRELADQSLKSPIYVSPALHELIRFLERPNLPVKFIDAAERQLDLAGPAARTAAIGWALSDLAIDREAAIRALKTLHADDSPLAKFAYRVSNLPSAYRYALEPLFTELPFARDSIVERSIPLLTSKDPELRRLAGSFLAADRKRCDPMRVVEKCIATGLPLTREALESMELDVTSVCDALASMLQSPDSIPMARVAAAQSLKSIGRHGVAIWALANSLLDDDDEDVRYIAGEVFNRQDIMNRARVPALLRELRSDSPTRRTSAANQIESLGVEPKEITDALIRAVKQGDMPAREGILRAIDHAYTSRANSLDTLRELAAAPDQTDPTTRAYARAALRALSTAP
jgi:hypothetical protein